MPLIEEHQELVDFFTGCALPTGPQHVNPYSVFLDLGGAVNNQLQRLQSDRQEARTSAALLLGEVKKWLTNQPISA